MIFHFHHFSLVSLYVFIIYFPHPLLTKTHTHATFLKHAKFYQEHHLQVHCQYAFIMEMSFCLAQVSAIAVQRRKEEMERDEILQEGRGRDGPRMGPSWIDALSSGRRST